MKSGPILIVDDNAVNLKLARVLLECEGYDVITASSAEDALDTLKRCRPVLILTDIQMPGMDGLALTQILKRDDHTRDIPVVALTAYAMKGDEERAMTSGCVGYVPKPIDTRRFAQQVNAYLSPVTGDFIEPGAINPLVKN